MRHAEAMPRGTPGYTPDAKRPLTDAGHLQAREVGRGLKRLKPSVDIILTSPYLRALQTAEHVAECLRPRVAVKEFNELRAEVSPHDTSLALKVFSHYNEILLIGHEPHLSAWIAELVAGKDGMRCMMKKGGVACIEVDHVPPPQGSGTLRWLMAPKPLTLIGQSR